MSIRQYIDLVEAIWWPQRQQAAPSPSTGMIGAKSFRPPAPQLPDNFSTALNDLAQAAYQVSIGHDDYYDQFEYLAKTLRSQASAAELQQFVPVLDQIIADPTHANDQITQIQQQLASDYA